MSASTVRNMNARTAAEVPAGRELIGKPWRSSHRFKSARKTRICRRCWHGAAERELIRSEVVAAGGRR
jgi:hypothetical protein